MAHKAPSDSVKSNLALDQDTPPNLMAIHVRADEVIDNGNGTFTLLLPYQPLSDQDNKHLERLFPNLIEQAHNLLNREALLSSIATIAEVQSKPRVPDGYKAVDRPGKYKTPPVARASREDAIDPRNPNGAVDIGD